MKLRHAVTAGAVALATAFAAPPAGAAQDPPPCDPGPCIGDVIAEKLGDLTVPTVQEVVWAVKCIGDSLGGNACTGG